MSDFNLTTNIYDLDQLSIGGQDTEFAGGAEDRNFMIYSTGMLNSWGFEKYPFNTTASIVSLGSGYNLEVSDGNIVLGAGATVDGVDVSAKDAASVQGTPFLAGEADPNSIWYYSEANGRWEYGYDQIIDGGGYTLSSAQKTDLTDGNDSTLHYHAADRARAVHTGSQLAATISDFQTTVSANGNVTTNSAHSANTAIHLSSLQKTGLIGEVNTNLHHHDLDKARASHTGTQAASTVSDFAEAVEATKEYLCLELDSNQAVSTSIPFTDYTWNSRAKSSGMTHTNGNANFTLPTPAAGETHVWEFVYSLGSDYNANNATARAPLLRSSGASWATVATPGMHASSGLYIQIPGVWSVAVTSASELSFKMQHYVSTAAAGKYWKTDRTFWNIKRIAVEYS